MKLLGPAQNSLVPPCQTQHHGSNNQKTYCHQIPQKLIPLITGEPDFSVVRLPPTFSGRADGHIWCCLGLRLCQSLLLYNVRSLCPSFSCSFISGSSDLIYLAIHTKDGKKTDENFYTIWVQDSNILSISCVFLIYTPYYEVNLLSTFLTLGLDHSHHSCEWKGHPKVGEPKSFWSINKYKVTRR